MKNSMKAKLRLLQIIDKKIGLENFYSVNINSFDISLQGYATSDLMNVLKNDYNMEFNITASNFIEGSTKNIKIVLTLKN